MDRERRNLLSLLALAAVSPTTLAQSPGFPNKPLRIVVPFTAGALTDIIARIYAEKLTTMLGQPVLVENKPGAGGVTASHYVLGVPPDGHTMLFVSSAHAVNPALRTKLPYDTEKEFSGLALLATSPSVVVVPAGHPARRLQDLIAAGKQKPNSLNYGSAGVGSATHLAGEYFRSEAGLQMVHVPYKGVQEAVSAVAGQQLDLAFPPIALALPMLKAGRIRALGVTSPQRAPTLAETPTVAESGYLGFDSSIWYALVMPAGTPKPVMNLLTQQVARIGEMPDVTEKLHSQGLVQDKLMLAQFDQFIASDIRKFGKLIRQSGITPE